MAPHRQRRMGRTIVAFAAAIPLVLILPQLGIDLLWSLLPVAIALVVHVAQMLDEDTP